MQGLEVFLKCVQSHAPKANMYHIVKGVSQSVVCVGMCRKLGFLHILPVVHLNSLQYALYRPASEDGLAVSTMQNVAIQMLKGTR